MASGFIARVSPYPLVETTPTYAASASGFGQMLTGVNARAGLNTTPEFLPSTVEAFFTCPTITAGQQTIFSTGNDGVIVNSAGKLSSLTVGITGATTLVAGKRYHVAYQRGPNGQAIYVQNITDATAGVRDAFTATPALATANSQRFTVLDYADLSRPMNGGGQAVDEAAVWQIEKYSGASYTAPTAPYTGNEADLVLLYHFDNDASEAVTANW